MGRTFDGNGKKIQNLKIELPKEDGIGLFGVLESGSRVKDLGLEGMDITGKGDVGMLTGKNAGIIQKSYASGKVEGAGQNVGGLVGYNVGTIENSYATGKVEGNDKVGGLVGTNREGKIENSYSTSRVNGEGENVGGFVGANEGGMIIGKNYWQTQTDSGVGGVGLGDEDGGNLEGKVEGKTEEELKKLDAKTTGWNTDTWEFKAGQNPKLKYQK